MNDEQKSKLGGVLLGRVINSKYEPLDRKGPITATFGENSNDSRVLETGIKAIDLLCPLIKGGKFALIGEPGVDKTALMQELIHYVAKSGGGGSSVCVG